MTKPEIRDFISRRIFTWYLIKKQLHPTNFFSYEAVKQEFKCYKSTNVKMAKAILQQVDLIEMPVCNHGKNSWHTLCNLLQLSPYLLLKIEKEA